MKIIIDNLEDADKQNIENLKNMLRSHDWSFKVKDKKTQQTQYDFTNAFIKINGNPIPLTYLLGLSISGIFMLLTAILFLYLK